MKIVKKKNPPKRQVLERIVMKMADKGKAEGVLARIENFIDTFEAQGRFTEDDYKRFILR